MEGKILGAGVIRGKDGKRYAFELNEVQNTQGKDIDEFIGSEVDFEIANEKAVSIYITEFKSISPNSSANLGANSNANSSPLNSQTPSVLHAAQNFAQKTFAKAEPLSPQMQKLKNKAFGAMALKVLGAFGIALSNSFPYELSFILCVGGLGVMFVSFLVLCNLIGSIQKHSKSQTLLKNLIIAEICGFAWGIMPFIQKTQWWQNPSNDERIFVALVALIILVLLVFYNYRYFKELALTTKQPLFLYAFWCGVTLILSPVALVLYVVAWVKFREVVEVEKDEKNEKNLSTHKVISVKDREKRYKISPKFFPYKLLLVLISDLMMCIFIRDFGDVNMFLWVYIGSILGALYICYKYAIIYKNKLFYIILCGGIIYCILTKIVYMTLPTIVEEYFLAAFVILALLLFALSLIAVARTKNSQLVKPY